MASILREKILIVLVVVLVLALASVLTVNASSSTSSGSYSYRTNGNMNGEGMEEDGERPRDGPSSSTSGSGSDSDTHQYELATPSGKKLLEEELTPPAKPEGFKCNENAVMYYNWGRDEWRCKCISGYTYVHRKCVMKHPNPAIHTEMLMPGARPPEQYDELSTKKSTKVWFLNDGKFVLKYFLKGRECHMEKMMPKFLRSQWIDEVPMFISETEHSVLMPHYGEPIEDFLQHVMEKESEDWPVERLEELLLAYVSKCVDILDRIHTSGVTLLDLKGYNILARYDRSQPGTESDRLRVTFIDLEGAKFKRAVDKDSSSYIYTYKYAAPEVVMRSERWITTRSDIWSFGVHVLKMIFANFRTGHVYKNLSRSHSSDRRSQLTTESRLKHAMLVHSVLQQLGDRDSMRWKVLTKRYKYRLPWSKHFISIMHRFVESMMVFNQVKRATARELLRTIEDERCPRNIDSVEDQSKLMSMKNTQNKTRFSKQQKKQLLHWLDRDPQFVFGDTKV